MGDRPVPYSWEGRQVVARLLEAGEYTVGASPLPLEAQERTGTPPLPKEGNLLAIGGWPIVKVDWLRHSSSLLICVFDYLSTYPPARSAPISHRRSAGRGSAAQACLRLGTDIVASIVLLDNLLKDPCHLGSNEGSAPLHTTTPCRSL